MEMGNLGLVEEKEHVGWEREGLQLFGFKRENDNCLRVGAERVFCVYKRLIFIGRILFGP